MSSKQKRHNNKKKDKSKTTLATKISKSSEPTNESPDNQPIYNTIENINDISKLQESYKNYWFNLEYTYNKMFEHDKKHIKLKTFLKEKELDAFFQIQYNKYYEQLYLSFLYLQTEALEIPGVTWYQIDKLVKRCNIFTHDFDQHSLDRIFQEVSFLFA